MADRNGYIGRAGCKTAWRNDHDAYQGGCDQPTVGPLDCYAVGSKDPSQTRNHDENDCERGWPVGW